ncbi:MAG: hypothetical protein ACE5IY_22330, partial [bacterium]
MVTESFQISKIDAAERQLKEAIRLVIQNRDPISTHTLACAAHQILYDLARKKGLSSNIKDIVPNRKKREWFNILNTPYNFFRHANKDTEKKIMFNPTISHFFILDATFLYQNLNNKLFYEGALFRLWFSKHYPNYLTKTNTGGRLT